LTADDPRKRRQVALLQPLLQGRKLELQSIIELRRTSGFDIARASASFELGKSLHDRIRAIVNGLNDDEWRSIRERNADVATAGARSRRGMDAVAVTVSTMGGGILILGWTNKKRRIAARNALRTAEADTQRLQTELLRNFELLDRVGQMAKIGGRQPVLLLAVLCAGRKCPAAAGQIPGRRHLRHGGEPTLARVGRR